MPRFQKSPPKDPEFPGVAELKSRGWSSTMIEKLLGKPDKKAPNPKSRKGAPMKFWALSRVKLCEENDLFNDLKEKAAKRSATMTASAENRINNMLQKVEVMEITIAPMLTENLLTVAQQAWVERNKRGRAERQSIGESDNAFNRRITVNYARHQLTKYDKALEETAERVGATAARARIRQRIYDTISQAYPHLEKECARQMKHRGVPEVLQSILEKKEKITIQEPKTRLTKFADSFLNC